MLDVTTTIMIDGESPRVGDQVRMRGDVLAEVARHIPGLPPTWRFLPAGAAGKLVGWRGESRAAVDVDDVERRLVVFVSVAHITRASPIPALAQRFGAQPQTGCNQRRVR
jgi:hypothetical protein